MLSYFTNKIKGQDEFATDAKKYLVVNKKKTFATLLGGFASIVMTIFVWSSWYNELDRWFFRKSNYMYSHSTEFD